MKTNLRKYFDSYLSYLKNNENKSQNTINAYKVDINSLIEYCEEKEIDLTSMDSMEVESYVGTLNELAPTTFNRRKVSLTLFLDYLIKHKILEYNFARDIKNKKIPQRDVITLSEEDAHKLANACTRHLKRVGKGEYIVSNYSFREYEKRSGAMILTLLKTGMRASECANFKQSDITKDGDNYTAKIIGKGNKERTIVLPSSVVEVINKWLDFRKYESDYIFTTINKNSGEIVPMTTQSMSDKVKKYYNACGINLTDPRPLHTLRRTYATLLMNRGVPIQEISKLLGHSDIKTTQGYLNVSIQVDNVADALNNL